jgi:hypothetical protein
MTRELISRGFGCALVSGYRKLLETDATRPAVEHAARILRIGRLRFPAQRQPAMWFVGECRSLTAQRKGWTWKDGRLAAKPLFEALEALGIDPAAQNYCNLWTDTTPPIIPPTRIAMLRARREEGVAIVALGKRVSTELTRRGIDHVALVHPAARGKIRLRANYIAHVRSRLGK